jgi:steroid delta-isomerase-like uncharacterized protein
MSLEKNKAAVRRHIEEGWNKRNLAAALDAISPDFVVPGPFSMKGPEAFSTIIKENLKAYPDVHITIDDMVAEDDKVAMHCTWTGTFTGEFFGMKPTGKPFKTQDVFFYRMKDGKIAEAWQLEDGTFKKQVGLPSPP